MIFLQSSIKRHSNRLKAALIVVTLLCAYSYIYSLIPENRSSSRIVVLNATSKHYSWSGFVEIFPDTFIYSAHYDDTGAYGVVRMIAISKTNNPPSGKLYCLLRDAKEKAHFYLVHEHHSFSHAAFIISCSYPKGMSREPGMIYLSILDDKNIFSRLLRLPIHHVTSDRQHKQKYTICLPPIWGNPISPFHFAEFIEMNRILGASNFIFYDYGIRSELMKVMQIYQNQGILQILPWNLPRSLSKNLHYKGQLASIQDCLYRCRGRSSLVGFQDLDEFIVPLKHTTIPSMIDTINDIQSEGFCFRMVLFPITGALFNSSSLITQTIFIRGRKVMRKAYRSKCIVIPRKVFEMGIHFSHSPVDYISRRVVWISPEKALLFHYRKHLSLGFEGFVNDTFMAEYKLKLTENVQRVMRLV